MGETIKVGVVQLQAAPDIAANLRDAEKLIRQAASAGARLVVTPENTCHMISPPKRKLETAYPHDTHPAITAFAALAKELGIWLVIGSIAVKTSDHRLANRQLVFNPEGREVAHYDKIHLFDVDLPTGESHRESDLMDGGDTAVCVDAGFAKLGLSICYDLRFAALYRTLAHAGASIMLVPAAFTVPTGQAHWHALLRARAIETGSFVLAPAQCGTHDGGRLTYGHSLIIGPWGDVLAEGSADKPELLLADLDLDKVSQARTAVPALRHDRAFTVQTA